MDAFVSTEIPDSPAFLRLQEQYKQRLMADTTLDKASSLAAQQEMILDNEDIPDGWKEAQLKTLSNELRQWTQKARNPLFKVQGRMGPSEASGTDPDEPPLQSIVGGLVKSLQKKSPVTPIMPKAKAKRPRMKLTPKITPSTRKAKKVRKLPPTPLSGVGTLPSTSQTSAMGSDPDARRKQLMQKRKEELVSESKKRIKDTVKKWLDYS